MSDRPELSPPLYKPFPGRAATRVDNVVIFPDGATRKLTIRERLRWRIGLLIIRFGQWITPSTAKRRMAKHEFCE